MKYLPLTLGFIFSQVAIAQSEKGLHRINFFPDVKAYFSASYHNRNLLITTPENAVNDSEVRNNQNLFSATYAYRFDQIFLGIIGAYEIASESAANFGIPDTERKSSQGYREPSLFLLHRLRKQSGTTGNIDLRLSFTDSWGAREVGGSTSNRLNGHNILNAEISHGMLEDLWEFKNQLAYMFIDEGEEKNDFVDMSFETGSFNVFEYSFTGQYELNPWLYINAAAAFEYRTVRKIYGNMGRREIQAGTGSVFKLGVKRPLGEWSVIAADAQLKRYDYFVQGETNFDGKATETTLGISYLQGF